MREFKFRVWDLEKKFYLNQDDEFHFYEPDRGWQCPIPLCECLRDKKRYVVQQCTEIRDKKNYLIYEGDILDFTARYKQTGPVEVIYYGASFGCVVTDDGGLKEFWNLSHIVQQHYPEIIGNIFENPELLKTI
jgi:hypothetical protein